MEVVMGIMIVIMIVGFSVWGHHDRMTGGHDKECPKEERIIKEDEHNKDDCNKHEKSKEDSAIDNKESPNY